MIHFKASMKTGVREIFCRIVFAFLTHDIPERHSTAITIILFLTSLSFTETKVLTHN